jgi:curli biogenesis system outer membrane secretion channel CsgG
MRKQLFIALGLALLSQTTFAQQKVSVEEEKIREKCKDLPYEQKHRISVTRFSVSTPARTREFGENMGTMLQNALQGVNCFRVLESRKNEGDLTQELDFANSDLSDKTKVAKKGKMVGAQMVVTGEVTEYNVRKKEAGIGMIQTGKEKVKLGFVIKIVNPQTRDLIDSKSIDVEGSARATTRFSLLGLKTGQTMQYSAAEADALEQGIIKAVEWMADKRASWPAAEMDDLVGAGGKNSTEVNLENTTFSGIAALAENVKQIKGVTKVTKTFSAGKGTLVVDHTGSSEELLDKLSTTAAGKSLDVVGMSEGKIDLKGK